MSIPCKALAADEEPLNKERIKQFLQTADIVKSRPSPRGITHPLRLTLSNGVITHDASFQAIDDILRGLSARAPYFHNGSAQTLLDAVRFYESRFGLVLTGQEESDLVAFLSSL